MSLLDNRVELKGKFKELNLFLPSGKFNKTATLPQDIQSLCFKVTPNCLSPELRDRLYWILHDIHDYPKCANCSTPIVKQIKSFNSNFKNQQHCSSACRFSDKLVRSKIEQKRFEKTGYSNPLQNPKIRAAAGATCLVKYGAKNPMQNFKIFQKYIKSRFKLKSYIAPSGAIFKYQGYENVALKIIFERSDTLVENVLINKGDMPTVFYFNSVKNRRSRYYPDIYVKDANLLVEIKSIYTYNLNRIEAVEKQAACKKLGYDHVILICNKTKVLSMI